MNGTDRMTTKVSNTETVRNSALIKGPLLSEEGKNTIRNSRATLGAISEVITKLGSKKKSKPLSKVLDPVALSEGTNKTVKPNKESIKQTGKISSQPVQVKLNKRKARRPEVSNKVSDFSSLHSPVKTGSIKVTKPSKEASHPYGDNKLTIVSKSTKTGLDLKSTGNSKKAKTPKLTGQKIVYSFGKKVKPTKSKKEVNGGRVKRGTEGALSETFVNTKLYNKLEEIPSGRLLPVGAQGSSQNRVPTRGLGHRGIIKKKLTRNNVNAELHSYRMDTDKEYRKQIRNLKELRPSVQGIERKLKPSFSLKSSAGENSRETLGCLGVHPHNYDSLIGYRKGVPIVNSQKTLQGIRRVLNYLTKVINTPVGSGLQCDSKMELLVIVDNVPNLDTAEGQNNYLSLLTTTIARIKPLNNLVILPKTMKEAIRYLTSRATIPLIQRKDGSSFQKGSNKKLSLTRVGTNPENLCGVFMINPAKSKLSDLANLVFSKGSSSKDKASSGGSQSSLGAIGSLCAKKGIPLISLCDISSPLTYCTYPIICNTRNLSEVYLVLDLLSYGLNQAATTSNARDPR